MKHHPPLVVIAALVLAACSKSPSGASADAPAPAPRANLSESLGFAPDAEGYSQPPPAGAPKPASASPITRVLTGKDGRTVEAVLLSRTERAVKIRRKADSAEFVIPLDKLSEADRTFIRESAIPLTPGG